MSTKKQKKFGNIKIAAQSLAPPDKDGWLTKQGGSIKTWKKRYFILKDNTLYYFKTPKDQEITGKIDIEASSHVQEEYKQAKKNTAMFSVSTANRVFYMFPDKPEEMKEWVDAIKTVIERLKSQPATKSGTTTTPTPAASSASNAAAVRKASVDNMQPRERLKVAKLGVKFLADTASKVHEFWYIWADSIPEKKDITAFPDGFVDYSVAVSADCNKLTWRVSGPQSLFIQRMVDFFWNVGAPESEIDRLNDVGASMNPERIGSWIDMSARGGMDGGWYFPTKVGLEQAMTATDKSGEEALNPAAKTLRQWCIDKEITMVHVVGRDMGAAPPRQTEMRLKLPGMTFDDQLACALSGWTTFAIPPIPEDALKIMKTHNGPSDLTLSVVTSVEGFVRVGILVPKPSVDTVLSLCKVGGVNGNKDGLAVFEGSLGKDGPDYVEFQHLMKGFGYGVYKEGFDIVLHYDVGTESAEQ